MPLRLPVRLVRFALPCTVLVITVAAFAVTATITKVGFRTITASGKQITFIFDGMAPNNYVRDVLVLRINRVRVPTLSGRNSGDLARMFTRMRVAEAPVFLSCPTGGVCAQPGTTSGPGEFCEDPSGCGVDVHNQVNTSDFTQGTDELYDCAQCCVDWSACTIDSGGGGGGGCLGGDSGNPGDSGDPYAPNCSPIIVDTTGEGFHLTSAADGVKFDIRADGHPIQIAWTAPGSHNAFLALDRNGDGVINSGAELFGNFTRQPASASPNGFAALAVYDSPENGGNGDGVIDAKDAIFSSLRLWIDSNYDGVCQPEELHTLPELGVFSISLAYSFRNGEMTLAMFSGIEPK